MYSPRGRKQGKIIAMLISMAIILFLGDIGQKTYAQTQKQLAEQKEEESFTRPAPTRPIRPEIPSANRYRQDKVFLEYADSLYKIKSRDTIERQILKGNVKFRQAGMWMYCDSAYYYPQLNSLDAFSNVRMEQGDTLFVYADKLFYNGDLRMAYLKNGPSRDKVTLINKDVTLNTDSLDYDLGIDLGWYSKWGTIDDKVNTLTSLYGEYSPQTKRADFYHDVVLVNNKDGFIIVTDTLHYNTDTHIADIESRTIIQSENDTIITNNAVYYTDSGNADLLTRSMIIHKDSAGNIITLEGDSIIYDNVTRISRAYMYRDPERRSSPMVLTDTAQKTTLIGGFGIYNDFTKEALATIYPLLMEYSQGDTLFLRADTIKTYLITEMVPVKTRRWTPSGFPEQNGIPIIMKDTINGKLWIDTLFFKVKAPYAETPLISLLSKIPSGAPILVKNNEKEDEISYALSAEETIANEIVLGEPSLEKVNQEEIISEEIKEVTPFVDEILGESKEKDNLLTDSIEGKIIALTDSLVNDSVSSNIFLQDSIADFKEFNDSILSVMKNTVIELPEEIIEIEEEDSIPKIAKEYHVALAYHRARFFKKDIQGVADSMVFVERDSILYMFRKPIVWSGERQVTGNRIDVHFNDSTADWAYLPEYGLMSEHVEEDFYNQITGKEIRAYFKDQTLHRMSVSGNVETIFLPQESDSTFNRLVNAESSYLDLILKDNKMDWLKMWPEVTGSVTPIFLVKKNQKYLQKFKWWGFLRPEREWYGNQVRWADNLGEVPDALEQYFMAPSDFGEPRSFTGPRIVLPPSSLTDWDEIPALEAPADTLSIGIIEKMADDMNLEKAEAIDEAEEIMSEIRENERTQEISEEEGSILINNGQEGAEEMTQETGEDPLRLETDSEKINQVADEMPGSDEQHIEEVSIITEE